MFYYLTTLEMGFHILSRYECFSLGSAISVPTTNEKSMGDMISESQFYVQKKK